MNKIILVGIVFFVTIPLTWSVCKLIEFFCKKQGKQIHYVYHSRKLNKTIDVDKAGD